jgi:tRNA nucleotidyltransferase (CCA-adding enzyme)
MLNQLKQFAGTLKEKLNGTLYLVGGCVRDMLMGIEPKDYDLELFGVWPKDFVTFLESEQILFKFNSDAKFPVYRVLINGAYLEIGLPRKDNKIGAKHSDYECVVDPFMSVIDAAMRRDFTVNGAYYNISTETYENTGFVRHVSERVLAPIHDIKFKEDALRIMRGFQFISRFDLTWRATAETIDNEMMTELAKVDPSGIYAEFCKGITKANNIEAALWYLATLAYRGDFFDIIEQMQNCPQNPRHHAEGNVWNHTVKVIKYAVDLAGTEDNLKVLLFWAAFFHDIGKIKVLKYKDGQPTAYGHDTESDELVEKYGARFGLPKLTIKRIILLKHCHMINNSAKDKKLFLMADKLHEVGLSWWVLFKLMAADVYGSQKTNIQDAMASHADLHLLIDRVKKLGIERKPMQLLISGDDVLRISGNKITGKSVGDILREIKDLQMNLRLQTKEAALDFLNRRINNILEKKGVENAD